MCPNNEPITRTDGFDVEHDETMGRKDDKKFNGSEFLICSTINGLRLHKWLIAPSLMPPTNDKKDTNGCATITLIALTSLWCKHSKMSPNNGRLYQDQSTYKPT